MANINNNIQVSAGLDSSEYLKGAKEVINAQSELNSKLVKGAVDTSTKLEAAVGKASLSGFKNAGTAAASAFAGALTGGIIGSGIAGAVTALASVIGTSVSTAISDLRELGDTAAAVGLTAEELYTFQRVFADIGISATQVNSLFDSLFKNIRRGAKEFEDFGVNVKNSDGSFKDINQVLTQTADLMASLEGSTEQAVVAQKLFGDNWKEVLEVLKEGSIVLEKNREKSEEQATEAAKASAILDKWGDAISKFVGGLKTMVGWLIVATDAGLKFAKSNILGTGFTGLLLKQAEAISNAAQASTEADKARAATAGRTRQTIAELKKVEEERVKAEIEAAKAKEKADKASASAAEKAARAAERATAEAKRLADAYEKLRSGGLKILEDISIALNEQISYLQDLAGYGEEYASTQADLRSLEQDRLDTITELNKQLKEGAINLKEYNKALDQTNQLSNVSKQAALDAASVKALDPLQKINLDQQAIDSSKGLFGDEALRAIDDYYIKQEALNISTAYFNTLVQGGAAGNVDGVNAMTVALTDQLKAQKDTVEQAQKDQAARDNLINSSLGAFKSFADSVIEGSESMGEAIKKLALQLLEAFVLAQALKALGLGNAFGGSSTVGIPNAKSGGSINSLSSSSRSGSINVYNYGQAPGGVTASRKANGDVDIVIGQITNAINRGGNSLDSAMRRSYGLSRIGV